MDGSGPNGPKDTLAPPLPPLADRWTGRLTAFGPALIITLFGAIATVLVANALVPQDQCTHDGYCDLNAFVEWLFPAAAGLFVTGFVAGLSSREDWPGVAGVVAAVVVLGITAAIVMPDPSLADLPQPVPLVYNVIASSIALIPLIAGFFGERLARRLAGRR